MNLRKWFVARFRSGHSTLLLILAYVLVAPSALVAQNVGTSGDGRRFYPDDPLWQDSDTMDIAEVEEFELDKDADFLINSFVHPGGDGGPALNVNTLGEVPDSSWFTNRIGPGNMTLEDIVRGPDTVDGPAPGGWVVTGRPEGGITPKFTIRDSRGDIYIFKLDPVQGPELPSSAEMISTKIFYALGYNVPEDFIVNIRRSEFTVDPEAMWVDNDGTNRHIEDRDVDHWLGELARVNSDGSIRVLASKLIDGTPVGQYRYYSTRSDDPNDIYPHEKRRQLRALRVFAAWLNHDDSRALNTYDAYTEESGRHFIKHYLLDFGSNLGSGSTNVQEPRAGNEYYIEGDKVLKGIFSFGLWTRGWMNVKYPDYPAVGNYEAEFFEPQNWRPEYPNPSFDRMDEADAFWAAGLMTHFTDEIIRAIVGTAQITDPEAERYLIDTLIKRRDKCIRYWIARTNPLDRFEINNAGTEVTFDNAAVRVGVGQGRVTYRVQWSTLDNLKNEEQEVGAELELSEPQMPIPQGAWGPTEDMGYRYAVVRRRRDVQAPQRCRGKEQIGKDAGF